MDKFLLLSWRKVLLIGAAWLVCVVLHNLVYAALRPVFGQEGDEPFFFLLAVIVIPLYTAACLMYSLVRCGIWFARKTPRRCLVNISRRSEHGHRDASKIQHG